MQARYYPRQPSQLSKSRTYSLFFQDNLTIGPRLVVNAGVLFNQDDFRQELASTNTFLTFGMGSQIQPRLGANYNLRKGAGDKVYGNYGRYYNSDQKSSARSLAPNRLFTNDALFDSVTGALISDTQGANTTGKVLRRARSDLHGRSALRLRDAVRRRLERRRVLPLSHLEGLHRGSADGAAGEHVRRRQPVQRVPQVPRLHRGAVAAAARQVEPDRELRADAPLGQLRPRLLHRRGVQHVVDPAGRPGRVRRGSVPRGPAQPGPHARAEDLRVVRADAAPHLRRLPARAERAAVGGARPRLVRRLPALHGAGRQPTATTPGPTSTSWPPTSCGWAPRRT